MVLNRKGIHFDGNYSHGGLEIRVPLSSGRKRGNLFMNFTYYIRNIRNYHFVLLNVFLSRIIK